MNNCESNVQVKLDKRVLRELNDETFQTALKQCRGNPGSAHSLPAECYRSDEIQEVESAVLFRNHWIGLGRADRCLNPGQFETIDVAKVPLVLTRDPSGNLNALHNVCRHRGTRLVDGAGSSRGIRCPFHAWQYNLEGRLVNAPHMGRADSFCRESYNLIRFPLHLHDGFLFVFLGDNAGDPVEQFGNFHQHHSPWKLGELVSTRRQQMEVNCNWKLFLDVFNEYYHLPTVHPNSISGQYQAPDRPDYATGAYATQFGSTLGTGGLLSQDQAFRLPPNPALDEFHTNGTRYTWLFPNMAFAASSDALWCYEAYPLRPDRCMVYQTICFPASTIALGDFEEKASYYYARLDAAIEEDILVLERQQQGMRSPNTVPGRFAPDFEPSVAAFANWYADQLISMR